MIGSMLSPRAAWLSCVFVASLAFASAFASIVSASSPTDLDRINGRWKVDWKKSDSLDATMKVLEVPWLFRKLVGVVPVHETIEVQPPGCEGCEPSLRIHSQNPVKDTDRVVFLDGQSRPHVDPLGNESMDRFTWSEEHGMEMTRERVLKSGKSVKIYERRTVTDDLQTMVTQVTVWVDGKEHGTTRRVLTKDPK